MTKVITGVYHTEKSEILFNNQPIYPRDLVQKYAVIFGDTHLFDKLFVIDYEVIKVLLLLYGDDAIK